MLWGLVCTKCKRQFRTGALADPCRACHRHVEAMDPEAVATAEYVDDTYPYRGMVRSIGLDRAVERCGFDVEEQVEYVARSLERVVTVVGNAAHDLEYLSWRIEQRCPICRVGIAVTFFAKELGSLDDLFRRIFELFDEHRCIVSTAAVAELRARAERESERMAERAAAIRVREQAEPPRGPSLYERAERESVVLAEWALAFGTRADV